MTAKVAVKAMKRVKAGNVLKKKRTLSSIANYKKLSNIIRRIMANYRKVHGRVKVLSDRARVTESKIIKRRQREKAMKSMQKERERAKAAVLKRKKTERANELKRRSMLTPDEKKMEMMVYTDFKEICRKIAEYDAEEAEKHAQSKAAANPQEESPQEDPSPSSRLSDIHMEDAELKDAVENAMHIFKDEWLAYALERDRGNMEGWLREDRACGVREAAIFEEYEDLKAAMMKLLSFVGVPQPHGSYCVLEQQGYEPPHHLEKGGIHYKLLGAREDRGVPESARLVGARIACLRRHPHFRALEAFCALMAVVSMRKEKSWIELFGTGDDIDNVMAGKAGCKSKGSALRKEEIGKYLEEEAHFGLGFFAHYMIKANSKLRVAFTGGVPSPIPVSLVITTRLPLFHALASENDDDGDAPMKGDAKSWKWCSQDGTQFALQDANLSEDFGPDDSRKCRVAAADLKADPEIRALLLDRSKEVVHLDVVASLAPREVAKRDRHSEIVKAELAQLMRDCKNRGEAVVFTLGSESPHVLAEKVYMRKPIGDYGLRCGYMRWRSSDDVPWSREARWDMRACICLQMP